MEILITLCLSYQARDRSCPSRDRGDKGVWRASWKMWMQAKKKRVNRQYFHYKYQDIIERNSSKWSVFFSIGCENDCQIDGIAKLAPVVAFYAGKPEMLEKVEQAVRVTQNNDDCVAETLAAARSVCSANASFSLPVTDENTGHFWNRDVKRI